MKNTYQEIIASTKLPDMFQSRSSGELVNKHVVTSTREPRPDFAAMQRLLTPTESPKIISEPENEKRG